MAKKKVFSEVGLFDETGRYGDWIGGALDTAFWLRTAEKYKIAIINDRLIYRRVSRQSGSGRYVVTTTQRANHFTVLDDFLKSPALAASIEPSLLRQYKYNKFWDDVFIARNFVSMNMEQKAREHLVSAMSPDLFVTGIKSFGNLKKLFVYGAFLIFTFLGCSGIIIDIVKGVRKKYGMLKGCKAVY
jgi:hypothetical protein